MLSDVRIESRSQESPFRETAWDQRLDKMLDDLKTTVHTDVPSRRDNSLTSSFRSTSRSDSRNSNKGVEDAGLMRHHHKEYTSPDKSTRIITDEFEYDSSDPHKAGQYHKKVKKSTYSSYKVHGGVSDELDALRHGPSQSIMAESTPDPKVITASQKVANKLVQALSTIDQVNPIPANPTTKISNGHDMDGIDDGTGGEVRRIVWRNRFEKTCESQDSSTPKLSIEEDAWRQRMKKHEIHTVKTSSTRPAPPQISTAGGQPWTEPIPLPTPPQLSPGEPGVAYVYTYGQEGGSTLQNLPPLNYVSGPPNGSASPQTDADGKPIIYHYSYHYNLPPGEKHPEGSRNYHLPVTSQPALEVAASPRHHPYTEKVTHSNPMGSYSYESSHLSSSNRNEKTLDENYHSSSNRVGVPKKFPKFDDGSPVLPRRGELGHSDPQNNLSITINKTTTHTTHTKEYTGGGPATSTPISERYGKPVTNSSTTYINQYSGKDSLERLKKPYQETKPFPETSPVNQTATDRIPRHVDDLMTTFHGESNIRHVNYQPYNMSNGPRQPAEHEPLIMTKRPERRDEIVANETTSETLKKEETKNLTGPPVYYPPEHQQLFDESMHTMSLKENKRQGMAKWRREAAMKEGASNKNSKGGKMNMVPVCLPLCCGAACVIM